MLRLTRGVGEEDNLENIQFNYQFFLLPKNILCNQDKSGNVNDLHLVYLQKTIVDSIIIDILYCWYLSKP